MGVTIRSKYKEVDLTYLGMFRMRKDIGAALLGEEFATLYEGIITRKFDVELIENLINAKESEGVINEEDYPLIDFLFMSDCGGKMSAKETKKMQKTLSRLSIADNKNYGYGIRPAVFSDFKAIVDVCAKKRLTMYWS